MRGLIFAFLLMTTAAKADDEIKSTYQATFDSVSTRSDCTRKDVPDFILFDCTKSERPIVWYFTRPGTPAHPGVMKRYISNEKDGAYMNTDAHSYGSDDAQPAFQTWMAGVAHAIMGH